MTRIAVGLSESFDPVEAFSEAASEARAALEGRCDLCLVFAGASHLGHAKWVLSTVHEMLEPEHLIGCGAGGVVGPGREIEEGPGAVVWAASMPRARIATHHLVGEPTEDGFELSGLPEADGAADCLVVLAAPYTFAADALLGQLNESFPGLPVLGGLASAGMAGAGTLFRGGDVLAGGAVACELSGVSVHPCVSQGAAPV